MTKRDRGRRAAAKRERRLRERQRRAPVFTPVAATFETKPAPGRLRLQTPKSNHASNPDFLDCNLDFGFLVRELMVLRKHNMSFTQEAPQESMLMFAEGALVLVAMERFLRTILGTEVAPGQTLPNLLELAFGDRLQLLDPPGGDRARVTRIVVDIRNALLHANFEQAARHAGAKDVRDYFRNHYAKDIEFLFRVLDAMVSQIDPSTGQRRETAARRNAARERFTRVVAARAQRLARAKR